MVHIKYILLFVCLTIVLSLTEANAWIKICLKKSTECRRRTVGKVCGYEHSKREYKVYTSTCSLYIHACRNRLDIVIVEMQKCTEHEGNKGQQKKHSRGTDAASRPSSVFVRPAKTVITEGSEEDVKIVCYAVGGNPAPEFSWDIIPVIQSGADPGKIPTDITSDVRTSSLLLKQLTREKSGTYTCNAYNDAGTVSASAIVDVQYKPTVTVSPLYKSIRTGQSAMFRCTADGNPKPSIVWKKGGVVITTSSHLLVRNAKLSDHGDYQCVAKNKVSIYSAEVRLNVRVDGGWSPDISCTQCGNNPYNNNRCQKKCERKCNNPTPQNGGAECSGDRYIARDCPNSNCKVPNNKKKCFPGDSQVPLASGKTAFMRDLKIGDEVLAVTSENKIVPSKVLTFLHREENGSTDYKDIQTDEQTISLTADHLIFVSEDGNAETLKAIYASKVQRGMYINEAKSGQIRLARVKSISNSTKEGMYAPLTEHGNILVDNVMSSCYAIINSHWLAHVGLSPLRWYYMYGGLVKDDVPKEGIHWYPTLLQPMLAVLPQS